MVGRWHNVVCVFHLLSNIFQRFFNKKKLRCFNVNNCLTVGNILKITRFKDGRQGHFWIWRHVFNVNLNISHGHVNYWNGISGPSQRLLNHCLKMNGILGFSTIRSRNGLDSNVNDGQLWELARQEKALWKCPHFPPLSSFLSIHREGSTVEYWNLLF